MENNTILGQFAYVYILTNEHKTTLYIGVTSNLSQRISQPKNSVGSKFTRKYSLTHLVYVEGFSQIEDAIRREKQLKSWKRAWKDALIDEFNPEWRDLSFDVLQF